jgi:Mg-chelatase subunit ChlD
MDRIAVVAALLLALSGSAGAQQIQGSKKPDPQKVSPKPDTIQPQEIPEAPARRAIPKRIPAPLEVMKARKTFRMTNRVLFVVDVSGSMQGQLQEAVENVMLIVQTPVDDLQVGLLTFNHQTVRWKGKPGLCEHSGKHSAKCVRPGWARVPDHYKDFAGYLSSFAASGWTEPCVAIKRALEDPEEVLTIVLVSDGDFVATAACRALVTGQLARKKKKLPMAQVMVWGVGSEAKKNKNLLKLAKLAGGGLWVHGGNRSGPW